MSNYLIKPGDTLSQIAEANKTDIGTLQKLNPQITNPDRIYAGSNLALPEPPAPRIPSQPTNVVFNQPEPAPFSPKPIVVGQSIGTTPTSGADILRQAQPTDSINAQQRVAYNSSGLSMPTEMPDFQSIYNQLKNEFKSDNTQALNDIYTKYDTEKNYNELKNITQQSLGIRDELRKLDIEEKDALEKVGSRPGVDLGFVSGEQARIQREYGKKKALLNSSLAGNLSLVQTLQGNIDFAKSLAEDYLQVSTHNEEQNWKLFTTARDVWSDLYDKLNSREKEIFDAKEAEAKVAYEQSKFERGKVAEWLSDADTAGGLIGVDLNAPYEVIAEKVKNYVARKNPATSGDTKFWSAINNGKSLLMRGESWGNVWNKIKLQFPSASDKVIDEALGVDWKEPGAFEKFKSKAGTSAESLNAILDSYMNSNSD